MSKEKRKDKDKSIYYAKVILESLEDVFTGENSKINLEDFKNDSNLTDFLTAVSNIAPTFIYNYLTGNNVNQLEFNHIANKLCFKYSNLKS